MYKSLQDCIDDLRSSGRLIDIQDSIDPDLEASSIHLREFKLKGKTVFYNNLKGTKYSAVSNVFGTIDRVNYIFRKTLRSVKLLIELRKNPFKIFSQPIDSLRLLFQLKNIFPKKVSFPTNFKEISISDLPHIRSWKKDGGAFITLPQVYSEDPNNPGIMSSNLGMYRVQLSGNNYIKDKEIGMHYQIHRGIGVHHKKANDLGVPLKVSIFIGGPPAHTFSSIMPLPEGMPELSFAGLLSGRRFRYARRDGYVISADADFVICGEMEPKKTKPEGPFGDHLGYYSLIHDFPYLKVKYVYAKNGAIFPFTVVGRPPQEDSNFGKLIHEIVGNEIQHEIPGLRSLNAVDAAGVHPLMLAVGSERYNAYVDIKRPQELLTISNHILGTGQLSLTKYLFICDESNAPDVNNEKEFFTHILERVDWERDMHFHTNITIDTLDYSGDSFNQGSKLVVAVIDKPIRNLVEHIDIILPDGFSNPILVSKGNLVLEGDGDIKSLISSLESYKLSGIGLITLVDDSDFSAKDFYNWVWVTFTRSNPSNDVYGLNERIINKHFSCSIPVIDARVKPHHAPVLER